MFVKSFTVPERTVISMLTNKILKAKGFNEVFVLKIIFSRESAFLSVEFSFLHHKNLF